MTDNKEALLEAAAQLADKINKGVDWSVEQAPGVVQDMVSYCVAEMWSVAIFSGICLAICSSIAAFGWRRFCAALKDGSEEAGWLIMLTLGLLSSIIALLACVIVLIDLIAIHAGPKWFIVEKLAEIAR